MLIEISESDIAQLRTEIGEAVEREMQPFRDLVESIVEATAASTATLETLRGIINAATRDHEGLTVELAALTASLVAAKAGTVPTQSS